MTNNLETKVVLKQRVLHGSNHPELLQRVATVYINGKEYRVSAPPEAKGSALDWAAHFTVRQLVDLNSEVEIHDSFGALALKVVKEELGKEPGEGAFDDRLPLYRRRVFDRDLDTFVKRTVEKQRPLSLLMLDLDKFKAVNDRHGHPTGDEVLVECGKIVADHVEGKGRAYRYGGEEIAVLLPNFSAPEGLAVGEELRKSIENAKVSAKALRITVSVGVACLPDHARDGESLLKQADAALYQAKRLGRNLVRISGDTEDSIQPARIVERREPTPGALSDEEQEAIRLSHFRHGRAVCPRDGAGLNITESLHHDVKTPDLFVRCPVCGLDVELSGLRR